MTKQEEAIAYFKFHRKIFCEDHLKICPKDSIAYQATLKEKEFYDMAIKALEQEQKSEYEHDHEMLKAYSDGANEVLDKIRAEIENHCGLAKENHCRYCSYCNNLMGIREILEIIDKYKTESEGAK